MRRHGHPSQRGWRLQPLQPQQLLQPRWCHLASLRAHLAAGCCLVVVAASGSQLAGRRHVVGEQQQLCVAAAGKMVQRRRQWWRASSAAAAVVALHHQAVVTAIENAPACQVALATRRRNPVDAPAERQQLQRQQQQQLLRVERIAAAVDVVAQLLVLVG